MTNMGMASGRKVHPLYFSLIYAYLKKGLAMIFARPFYNI